jgi:hypothetical protein
MDLHALLAEREFAAAIGAILFTLQAVAKFGTPSIA